MRNYIEIQKNAIPYSFNIVLGGQWYELAVDYNKTADMFTVAVYKDGELLTSEPLVLDVPLFQDTYQPGFPAVTITPYDASGTAKSVTWDNLGESVFLTIDDESGGNNGE